MALDAERGATTASARRVETLRVLSLLCLAALLALLPLDVGAQSAGPPGELPGTRPLDVPTLPEPDEALPPPILPPIEDELGTTEAST